MNRHHARDPRGPNRSAGPPQPSRSGGPRLAVLPGGKDRPAAGPRAPAYEWLSAEDRMFLRSERPDAHMHVGATLLFEAGPLGVPGGGVDVRRIRQYVNARLSAIPRYRQRLMGTPFNGPPVWIDDPAFDLAHHVRSVRVPAPGDAQALRRLSGRIMSEPLDRGRPLWELWVIDGFASGRFAIVSKMHHCMVDGIAGADLLAILLSPAREVAIPRAAHWTPRPAPDWFTLLRDRLAKQVSDSETVAGELLRVARRPAVAAEWGYTAAAFWRALGLGLRPAPETPFNRPIGPHRRFDWLAFDFAEVKGLKDRLGGTINDVVLATVAGAVRRFVQGRDAYAALDDLRVLVPVNTRPAVGAGALGNHVSAWLLPLPIREPDPLRRFATIRAATARLKGTRAALAAEALTAAGTTLLGAGMRWLHHLRPFNLVVTNIPGPPIPLFLLGAPLEDVYPEVPLFPNQGLGIALFSYAGKLCWGFNADCQVVPDLEQFVAAVGAAFHELTYAARGARRSSSAARRSP